MTEGYLESTDNRKKSRDARLQYFQNSIEVHKGLVTQGLSRLGKAWRGLDKCRGGFVEGQRCTRSSSEGNFWPKNQFGDFQFRNWELSIEEQMNFNRGDFLLKNWGFFFFYQDLRKIWPSNTPSSRILIRERTKEKLGIWEAIDC